MEPWRQELYHHGIKGMKWGVRRTPEQLGHRTVKNPKNGRNTADDKKKAEMQAASKNRRLLSTEEIRNRIERIKLERQLKDLTDEELTPGRKFVKDVMSNTGKKVISTVATGATLYAVKAAFTGKVNMKELGDAVFNGGPKKK